MKPEHLRLAFALLVAALPVVMLRAAMPTLQTTLSAMPWTLPAIATLTFEFYPIAALLPLVAAGVWWAEPKGRLRGIVSVWASVACALLTPLFLGFLLYFPVWQLGRN